MSCPESVIAFSAIYSLMLLLPLTLTNCAKRKLASQISNPDIASSSTTRVVASNSGVADQSKGKDVAKEGLHKKEAAQDLIPEQTQVSTPRLAEVKQPFNPSVDAIDLEDEDEGTRDDAPSLKPARPDLPSTTVTKVMAKTKLKSNDLVKEDVTVQSERTVREVRAPSARKQAKKKELHKDLVTVKEKHKSRKQRKKDDDVQCTQEQE